jgi:hypothetical protein
MGHFYLIAQLALVLVASLNIVAAVLSARRAAGVSGYRWVSAVSAAVIPFVLIRAHPSQQLEFLFEGVFSLSGAACIAGPMVCVSLRFAPSKPVRLLSGLTWGFFSTMMIRLAVLLAQQY